jgi:ATP-dependent helicase/nuclease subunit A
MTSQLANVRMVSASAGTGKTYYLTDVIADQIVAGTPASGILATTFTRKAAGELKERIAAKLLDRSGQEQSSGQLRDAAQQLSVSLIGTVNSVCGQLLREYAIHAGLSPALEQIPEDEQKALFRMATDSVLSDYSDRILPVAERLSLATDGAWVATIQAICEAARTNMLEPAELAQSAERSWEGFREVLGDRAPTDCRASWLH